MGWLGDACKCRCGWACDPTDEKDWLRKCEKCGTYFIRKSYGWCQLPDGYDPKLDILKNGDHVRR